MRRTTLLVVFAALGLAVALGLTARSANAYDIHQLPTGYTTQHTFSGSGVCSETWTIFGYGTSSAALCADSDSFQADVDSFVNATCPVTVCVPPAPSTTTADVPPTTTDAQPPATTTDTTATAPTIEARIAALEANYAALSKRVDAVAQANDASWAAFIAAKNAGASTVDAALAARSAGQNAIYQLG